MLPHKLALYTKWLPRSSLHSNPLLSVIKQSNFLLIQQGKIPHQLNQVPCKKIRGTILDEKITYQLISNQYKLSSYRRDCQNMDKILSKTFAQTKVLLKIKKRSNKRQRDLPLARFCSCSVLQGWVWCVLPLILWSKRTQ